MPGLLHSVTVAFTALVGGFVGPVGAAASATATFGRTVGRTINTVAGMRGRLDAIGREMTTLQRRMNSIQGNSQAAQAQRRAIQQRMQLLQDERTMLMRQQQAIQRVGQTATVAGFAMVAAFGMAVKAAADFDKTMSKVASVSNASAEDLNALRKAALQAGKDTKYSATQAAQAEAELTKAGVATKDILGGALTGALSLAAAGELDLADAATVAAQSMNIFGLKGKDVGHVADVLAAGANKSAADVKGLAWSLRMGGQVAAQTGLKLEDTVGVLSAFADNALIGSDAGTSLKVMLQHLANPSDKARGLMNDLGLEVYDASGNFVGMSQLAANLQTALGGLTQEQRDMAMATIFGSDAVRGANILYKIGSDGVKKYTTAVNDNGAAARTAAKQMDNLAGDLELLKGSLETALIQSGSGANNVLREMIQLVNGAVNAYLALPPSVQSTLFVVIGLTGAVILLAKGLIFMVTTAKEAKIALAAIGITGPRVASALTAIRGALMTTASFMMGPWGIAIAAAVGVLAVFTLTKKKATKATEEFTQAIEADSGALGANTRAAVVNELEKEGLLQIAQKLGISEKDLTDAVMGNKDALDRVNAAIKANGIEFDSNTKKKGLSREESAKLLLQTMQLQNGIEKQSDSLKASTDAAKRKSAAMGENTEKSDELTNATKHVTEAVQSHTEAEQKLIETMEDAKTTAADLKTAFDNLAKANMDVDRANIKVRESTAAAAKASDHRKGLSDKERESLLQLADTSQDALIALKGTGVYGDELFAKQRKLADAFIKSAMGMGASSKEARELARRYGLLTSSTDGSMISLDSWISRANSAAGAARRLAIRTGGDAKDANNAFKNSIQNMLPVLYALTNGDQRLTGQVNELAKSLGLATGKVKVSREAFLSAARAMGIGTDEANKLWKAFQKIKSKSVHVSVDAKGYWALPKNEEMHSVTGHNYWGGRIVPLGPDSSRDRDSVPSMLRVDEHVWTPEEVDAVGGHAAMYRMRRMALAGQLKGFYVGGAVGSFTQPGAAKRIMTPIDMGYNDLINDMAAAIAAQWKQAMSGGSIVAAARSMIGYPYSWGGGGAGGPSYGIGRGAGTFGFDCSGLTEYAWWKGRHVHIGGTTYEQWPGSHSIGSPRPGALGFPHMGHVVVASGSGTIIQAPYTGSFVQEVPISRSYTWRWPNNAGYAKGGQVTPMEAAAGRSYTLGDLSGADLRDAKIFGLAGDPGRVRGYADGGRVTGPAGIDRLLLRGTAGEYMVNAGATRRYGPLLDMINHGAGASLLRQAIRPGAGAGITTSVTVVVQNHGVLGSQAETEAWLTSSMEQLRRKGKLPVGSN